MHSGAVTISVVGLMVFLYLCLAVSAQEAAPGFVSRLTAVAPLPVLAEAAKLNQIPLVQIDPRVETNRFLPGDSFTAVVTLFSKGTRMQWLLFLQALKPTPKEQAQNPPRSMVLHNTLGHKLEFLSTPAFVTLRTIGPYVEGETGQRPKDKTTRFVLDQGFLVGVQLLQCLVLPYQLV